LSNARVGPFDCRGSLHAARPARTGFAIGKGVAAAATLLRRALPQHCALCVAASGPALLCDACAADLPTIGSACPVCALPSGRRAICGACAGSPPPFSGTLSALAYAFPVDRLIRQIKYGGNTALVDWAGATLASAVSANLVHRDPGLRPQWIVALPLSASRQRERGFNQAMEIAVRVAAATALPVYAPLERVRAGPPQASLPWAVRQGNVRGAFAVRRRVPGARIALVDDVMTTGATLAEASRTLIAAGARRVECWVVARTPRPDED
jgi:ComF family protein